MAHQTTDVRATMPRADDVEGPDGNSRLTAVTGMVLLVMLLVECGTILRIRQLITVHIYLGLLLLGPVALKSAATGYRFLRYYGHAEPYVRRGPPHPVLRVLAPFVMLTTLSLLGTGVALALLDKSGRGGTLLLTHQVSFFLWAALMVIHVLGHFQQAVRESVADLRAAHRVRGRGLRLGILAAALVVSVAAASALLPSASAWTKGHHDRPAVGQPHR
jgi:hypothetical protein